jgi:hypothetical protein
MLNWKSPPPVNRKLSRKDEEIAVLKRWPAKGPKGRRDGSRIAERLTELELATRP